MTLPGATRISDPERLRAVGETRLLDTRPEASFDSLAGLAAKLLNAPYAFLTLVDEHRSFWKSRVGDGLSGQTQNRVEESFCQYVVATGTPLIVGDAANDPVTCDNPSVQALGVAAWAGFPLWSAGGQVLGTLCVVDTQIREWLPQDVEVLRVLSQAASRELALRETIAKAELANSKLNLLSDVGHALAETLDVREAVARLARMVVPLLGDWSVVSVLDPDGRLVDRGWWHGEEPGLALVHEFVQDRLSGLEGRGATHRAKDSRQPVIVTEGALESGLAVLRSERAKEAYRQLRPGSYAAFPLVAGDRVHGVMSVVRAQGRPPMTQVAIDVATGIATRAGLALENARLYEAERTTSEHLAKANAQILASGRHDRAVARALQDALLTTLPTSSEFEFAARYLTAGGVDQVGGDFYDAIVSSRGTTLVIGDVCGHDIQAAAVMGQVRNMLRAFAWTHPEHTPAELISLLDQASRDFQINRLATMAVLRTEPGAADAGLRRLVWSNAGHLPPLVIAPDGEVDFLSARPDHPLGVRPRLERTNQVADLAPGSVLLMYTDGLVETRLRDVDTGLRLLADSVRGLLGSDLDTLVEGVLGVLVDEEPADDVAVFAARLI